MNNKKKQNEKHEYRKHRYEKDVWVSFGGICSSIVHYILDPDSFGALDIKDNDNGINKHTDIILWTVVRYIYSAKGS